MNRSALWSIGFVGLVIGVVAVAGSGLLDPGLAAVARGYGVLVIGAAVYLLVGLAARDLVRRWMRRPAVERQRPASARQS